MGLSTHLSTVSEDPTSYILHSGFLGGWAEVLGDRKSVGQGRGLFVLQKGDGGKGVESGICWLDS